MPSKSMTVNDLAPATKKVVKRKPAATPMPTLVQNSQLTEVSEMLTFTAGKARAIVDRLSNEATMDLYGVLKQIRAFAERGITKRTLSSSFTPAVIQALVELGYKIEPLTATPRESFMEKLKSFFTKNESTSSKNEHEISW